MNNKQTIHFEFECIDLPQAGSSPYAHWRLGVQEKQEVRQDVPCAPEPARFRFAVEVVITPADDAVAFRGGYVHGPRRGQFVYLSWGERVGEGWQLFRRAKIPLGSVSRQTVEQALRENRPIRARIRMTDARGEPVAASVKADYIEWLG